MFLNKRKQGFSTILLVLFLSSLLLLGYYYKEGKISLATLRGLKDPYCNIPILITLGDIDKRFNLSTETISKELNIASNVWEKEAKKDLFIFDGKGKSKVIVNFVYDDRQKETVESTKARASLESGWAKYESLIDQRKVLAVKYDSEQSTYDLAIKKYNVRLENLEKSVRAWNKKQGSEAEYRALQSEQSAVDQMFNSLEKQRITINSLAAQINTYNEKIKTLYNGLVTQTNEYNHLFSSDDPITIGEYDGTYYINIYQYSDLAQLRVTLAHELGHALGMDHVENEKSIMYPLQSKQSGETLILTAEDLSELSRVCEL
jgi:predicted Zn-dependent protease